MHEEVSPGPAQVPAAWLAAPAFHLAPMPLAVQGRLVRALRGGDEWVPSSTRTGAGDTPVPSPTRMGAGGALLSIDPHEPITEQSLPLWREILADADAFFPSEDELRLDGAQDDPHAALRRLACGRLRFVGWKRGLKGGILYDAHADRFHEWAARTTSVIDPTGAGDAFAAGFLTAHLEGRAIPECLQRGVVTASFAIEAWGPAALLAATRAELEARTHAWYGNEATA